MKFIKYKGFKIEKNANVYILWGKSLFDPVDVKWCHSEKLADCKKAARIFLKQFRLESWPALFPDHICKR